MLIEQCSERIILKRGRLYLFTVKIRVSAISHHFWWGGGAFLKIYHESQNLFKICTRRPMLGLLLFAAYIRRDSVFVQHSVFLYCWQWLYTENTFLSFHCRNGYSNAPLCWVVWHCMSGQDTNLCLSAFRNATLISKLSTGFWLQGHGIRC